METGQHDISATIYFFRPCLNPRLTVKVANGDLDEADEKIYIYKDFTFASPIATCGTAAFQCATFDECLTDYVLEADIVSSVQIGIRKTAEVGVLTYDSFVLLIQIDNTFRLMHVVVRIQSRPN